MSYPYNKIKEIYHTQLLLFCMFFQALYKENDIDK